SLRIPLIRLRLGLTVNVPQNVLDFAARSRTLSLFLSKSSHFVDVGEVVASHCHHITVGNEITRCKFDLLYLTAGIFAAFVTDAFVFAGTEPLNVGRFWRLEQPLNRLIADGAL